MKISRVDLYHYELPLAGPLVFKGRRLEKRRGLLLSLTDTTGCTGWGDIAPLPGFSRESFREAAKEALQVAAILHALELPVRWTPLEGNLSFIPGAGELTPSVTFGIELALWNLWSQLHEETAAPPENAPARFVLLNGLLTGEGEEVPRQAETMAAAGYQAVKLKVGRRPVEEDIQLTLKVREAIGPGVALRLDANRAWRLEEALEFATGVMSSEAEYIEEPLAKVTDLSAYTDACQLPVALDETLLEIPPDHWKSWTSVKAIVLKATLLGGLHRSLVLAREARRLGIIPIISSSFESGIGILGLARLANLACAGIPAGLDTYRWLASDVIRPRLETSKGRIDLTSAETGNVRIDLSALQVLADA